MLLVKNRYALNPVIKNDWILRRKAALSLKDKALKAPASDNAALRLELFDTILKGKAPGYPEDISRTRQANGLDLLQSATEAASPFVAHQAAEKDGLVAKLKDKDDNTLMEHLSALQAELNKRGSVLKQNTQGVPYVPDTER